MLVNPDIIATVTTGELKNDGPHIIGQTKTDAVTFIQFKNNSGTFVQESLDEVEKMVDAANLSATLFTKSSIN